MNDKEIHKAIFGSPDKPLNIGGVEIQCYVLDNGERVISGRGLQDFIIGTRASGGDRLIKSLRSKDLIKLMSQNLEPGLLEKKIQFSSGNLEVHGYSSDVLIDVANLKRISKDC